MDRLSRALGTIRPRRWGLAWPRSRLILALRRFVPRLPFYLIAIAPAPAAAVLLHLPVETVGERFPAMPTGLPMPAFPRILARAGARGDAERLHHRLPGRDRGAALGDGGGRHDRLSPPLRPGAGRHGRRQHRLGRCSAACPRPAPSPAPPPTSAPAAQTPVAGMLHAAFLLLFMLLAGKLIALRADGDARRGAADGRLGDERATASAPCCAATPASGRSCSSLSR